MLSNQEFRGIISLILKESIKVWGTTALTYFGEWAQGCGFPKQYQGSQYGEILFCKVSDMNLDGNDIYIEKTVNTITSDLAQKIRIKIHPAGTVIFPKIGGAIATNKRRIVSRRSAIDNNCTGIIPNKNTNSKWLYYMLRYFDFSLFQTGTSVPALNQGTLEKNVHLPKVPLPEQGLVSNFLDYLEKDSEKLENAPKLPQELESLRFQVTKRLLYIRNLETLSKEIETQLEFINKLRQAILQEVVRGKLVQQDAKDESALELFGKIKAKKEGLVREGKIKKEKDMAPINEEEISYELPNGWVWVRLNEAIDVRDGTHDTPNYVEEGIPLITSSCFENGRVNFEIANKISLEDHNNFKKRSLVEKEDILFSMIGGNLGNMVKVETDREFSIKNVALFKYYSKELTLPDYLHLFLRHLAALIQEKSVGGAQPFVSLKYFRNYLFPLPPFAEQRRIVERANLLLNLCHELEAKVMENKKDSELLMGAILKEAFAS